VIEGSDCDMTINHIKHEIWTIHDGHVIFSQKISEFEIALNQCAIVRCWPEWRRQRKPSCRASAVGLVVFE